MSPDWPRAPCDERARRARRDAVVSLYTGGGRHRLDEMRQRSRPASRSTSPPQKGPVRPLAPSRSFPEGPMGEAVKEPAALQRRHRLRRRTTSGSVPTSPSPSRWPSSTRSTRAPTDRRGDRHGPGTLSRTTAPLCPPRRRHQARPPRPRARAHPRRPAPARQRRRVKVEADTAAWDYAGCLARAHGDRRQPAVPDRRAAAACRARGRRRSRGASPER